MAKNRVKQREHLNCGLSREERLRKEAAQKEEECRKRREEKLDLVDFCGIKDPTPYEAVKNIIRRERTSQRTAKAQTGATRSKTATAASTAI